MRTGEWKLSAQSLAGSRSLMTCPRTVRLSGTESGNKVRIREVSDEKWPNLRIWNTGGTRGDVVGGLRG